VGSNDVRSEREQGVFCRFVLGHFYPFSTDYCPLHFRSGHSGP
jgi:hypothetical protein